MAKGLILAAFQEEGWPAFIDDPLPPKPGSNPKVRLHSAIASMNQSCSDTPIRFIGNGDGCAKQHDILILLLRRIDNFRGLHPAGEISQPPINLAQFLAAIDVIAIFRAITIARCPADYLGDLGPLRAEQMVVARFQRGQSCRSDGIGACHAISSVIQ